MADHNLVFWRCRNKEPHSSEFLCRLVLSGTKSSDFFKKMPMQFSGQVLGKEMRDW